MSLLNKVVVFGSDDGAASGVQIIDDVVANVDSKGKKKSEYYPGESRYYLVIVPEDFKLISVQCTDGTIVATGGKNRTQTDRILFTEKDKKESLSQLPNGALSRKWYGNNAILTFSEQQVSASAAPCVADITYNYKAVQYRLTAPSTLAIGIEDGADWPIGIVVYVENKSA